MLAGGSPNLHIAVCRVKLRLRVQLCGFLSIVFAVFIAPTGLLGVPSFLFFIDVTSVQPLLDCEELRNRILPAGESLNMDIGALIKTEYSLAIVLRVILALYASCSLNCHAVN
jgi:hypothetical protein